MQEWHNCLTLSGDSRHCEKILSCGFSNVVNNLSVSKTLLLTSVSGGLVEATTFGPWKLIEATDLKSNQVQAVLYGCFLFQYRLSTAHSVDN
jgi:2-methylisocitrate lyase-like PEP mutase family enzyme